MDTNETAKNLYSNGILKDSATIMSFFFMEFLYVAESFSFPQVDYFICVNYRECPATTRIFGFAELPDPLPAISCSLVVK